MTSMEESIEDEFGGSSVDVDHVEDHDLDDHVRQSLYQVVMAFRESSGVGSGDIGGNVDLESRFTALSLAFNTDRLTLSSRVEQQRRQRDTAESNVEKEIKALKEAIASPSLCSLSSALDVLQTSVARVSSIAEQYGAVQQEARMARAVHLMLGHVQHLKRAHQRDKNELENVKRILAENGENQGFSESLSRSRSPVNIASSDSSTAPFTVSTTTSTVLAQNDTITDTVTSSLTTATTTAVSKTTRFRSVSAINTLSPSLSPSSTPKSMQKEKMRRQSSPAARINANLLSVNDDNDNNFDHNENVVSNKSALRKLGLVMHTTNTVMAVRKFSDSVATINGFSTIEERCEMNNNNDGNNNSIKEDCKQQQTCLKPKFRSISEDFTASLVNRHKVRSLSTVASVREEQLTSDALMDELDALAKKRACSTVDLTLKQRLLIAWHKEIFPKLREWSNAFEWPWESEEMLWTLRYALTTVLLLAAFMSLLITFLGDTLF